MSASFDIPALETRIKAAGLSIDQFCDRASVDRATWQRWKAGTTKPLWETWMRVQSAVSALPERAEAAQ